MPSCQRFYTELYNCLIHSSCVLKHENSPQKCLDMIPDKLMTDQNIEHPIAPIECRAANRAWAECQMNLVRFI